MNRRAQWGSDMAHKRGGRLYAWVASAVLACGGCSFTSAGRMAAIETQNRSLIEQNKAQAAEIENLRAHNKRLENRLVGHEAPDATSSP